MLHPWKNIEGQSKSALRELQNRKLHHFINDHVYPFSPYYRALFDTHKIDPQSIRTVEDLKRIPFTSKTDFAASKEHPKKFRDFILQPDQDKIKKAWSLPKLLGLKAQTIVCGQEYVKAALAREYRPVFMTFTTGTTSTPTPFVYTKYDFDNLYLSGNRMMELFDLNPDEKIVNMFPFAPHLAFWQVYAGGMEAGYFTFHTGGGRAIGTEGNLSALQRIQPAMILGVPSYVYHVLRTAAERGEDMSFVKRVVLGAARVTVGFKQKLAELLESMGARDVAIFGTYGFTEARCAWAESPTAIDQSSGYHLYPDKDIFEIIDPETGEVKGEGEDGEIVYTGIDARGSVVLRYRTGDFCKGGIVWSPCPYSGRTTPRLSSDISRLSDQKDLQLSKVKGSLVNFHHFGMVLSDIPEICEWQIEIRKKDDDPYGIDEIILYVTQNDGADCEALSTKIRKKMALVTEINPNAIEYISLEEIVKRLELETANKDKRVVDRRPKE